ncbi:MAG TPA: C39 family peptidase [Candidatus Dormibacteraeota bacterium]|nr:C39 family peptidase [Candidatus Dormibacteraeota bacterium]
MKRFACAFLLLFFLGRTMQPASQESAGVWLDVPFVKQAEDGCGSAAISMVLQYWSSHGAQVFSERADAATIQRRLYSRKVRGIYASDLESYLIESGFRVFPLHGEWKDLREQLVRGRPLIVSLQPGNFKAPLHYVVVTGIDWQKAAVFINDPVRGKLLRIERADFEKEWRSNFNWMLLTLPEKAV